MKITEIRNMGGFDKTARTFYKEIAGNSSETKPTDTIENLELRTGDKFLETDTGDVYAFDEESAEWTKICSLGG